MGRIILACATPLLLAACARSSPEADADLAVGMPLLFQIFEEEDRQIGELLRNLETQTYTSLDLASNGVIERSFEPVPIAAEHVAGVTHPGRDLNLALGIAASRVSPHDGDDYAAVVVMPDQRPVEPYSPDLYDRAFTEGGACFVDRSCAVVRTDNDLIKKNPLMQVRYRLLKDFRWVDMSDDDDAPRWAMIARSWQEESATGDGGKATIHQSFSIEFHIPRDGRGFVLADAPPDMLFAEDSTAGGTLRVQAVYSETEFTSLDVGENVVRGTVRSGIDKNFEAADDFMAEQ